MARATLLRWQLLVCALACLCLIGPAVAQEKAPAPDKEAQEKAEKLIKNLFKTE
jgi:hypothetical protein